MRISNVIVAALATVLIGGACKGESREVDRPETLSALDTCRKNLDEKDKLIKAEEAENANLMRGGGGSNELVVVFQDNILTVKPPANGGGPPIDTKAAAAASQQFINVVQKSRGEIQKCYEQALRKRSDLQARTITLTVQASFSQQGAYQDASFSPSLGDAFEQCMKTVASKWSVPTNSPAMMFRAPVSLTPS